MPGGVSMGKRVTECLRTSIIGYDVDLVTGLANPNESGREKLLLHFFAFDKDGQGLECRDAVVMRNNAFDQPHGNGTPAAAAAAAAAEHDGSAAHALREHGRGLGKHLALGAALDDADTDSRNGLAQIV
jgi:hypothetical protein